MTSVGIAEAAALVEAAPAAAADDDAGGADAGADCDACAAPATSTADGAAAAAATTAAADGGAADTCPADNAASKDDFTTCDEEDTASCPWCEEKDSTPAEDPLTAPNAAPSASMRSLSWRPNLFASAAAKERPLGERGASALSPRGDSTRSALSLATRGGVISTQVPAGETSHQ